MLISLNEAHFSIVAHREEVGSVLVRAKRAGDIKKYWPGANIMIDEGTGFLERAVIPRYQVAGVISQYILNELQPDNLHTKSPLSLNENLAYDLKS